ncbi:MAG: YggT family protein [Clostridiales bacterium]|nr:YggT family protein [Clostridiales bacterium]
MTAIIHIFEQTVYILLWAMEILMFLRALSSWIIADDDSPFVEFLYSVTEPMIFPVRKLLDGFGALKDLPIDLSFIVTFILLSVVRMLLAAFMI